MFSYVVPPPHIGWRVEVLVVVVIVTTVTVVGVEVVEFEWVGVVEEGVDVA
jgi:hypothetical protein